MKSFQSKGFSFVETPHPFIYHRFLRILEDWEPELVTYWEKENKKTTEEDSRSRQINGHKRVLRTPQVILRNIYQELYRGGKYELYRQIALYDAKDQTLFDVKRLVYSLLIVRRNGQYSNNFIVEKAVDIIFKEQLATGLLPISHVVNNNFVIKKSSVESREVVASPILSSFECFSDMLSDEYIRKELKVHHDKFRLTFEWIQKRLRNYPGKDIGWYPEYESTHMPVAWITSPILMFLKKYCELLSELMSESASKYFKAEKIERQEICDTYSVKELVNYMKTGCHSALIFGPPGTGKSTISRYLTSLLPKGWVYIELIPNQFLDMGEPNIIPKANEIFKRLSRVKKAVILFDEVDL